MIRILVENILIFLIPTLLYAAYVVLTAPASQPHGAERTIARVLDEAPYLWLFTAGAILVILSVIAFGSVDGGKPGTPYQPPVYKDGHILPGKVK